MRKKFQINFLTLGKSHKMLGYLGALPVSIIYNTSILINSVVTALKCTAIAITLLIKAPFTTFNKSKIQNHIKIASLALLATPLTALLTPLNIISYTFFFIITIKTPNSIFSLQLPVKPGLVA